MKRLVATLLLCGTLFGGCATGEIPAPFTKPADTVSFPRGQAFKTYSSIRVAYARLKLRMDLACKAGQLDPHWCQTDLARLDEEATRVDRRIMDSLANPAVEVDWQAVYEAVELVMKLAGAVL